MVTLSPYAIDQTEVRVEDYGRCVSAGACSPSGLPPGDPRFDRPSLPVTYVTWDDAGAYCAWAGGRLPTEAEWEFAARGASSREYPWGEIYNPHLCNHGAFTLPWTDIDASDGFVGLAPVGSFPDGATPEGIVDMAGNVSEWVFDFGEFDEHGLASYPSASQYNPKGPPSGERHIIRGGSYLEGAAWVRTASRGVVELLSASDVGFRCVSDLSQPSR
jgi:sulfatase modifying factor 1